MDPKTSKSSAKRLVKNPETFREKAQKATDAKEQPSRRFKPFSLIGKALKAIFSPLANGVAQLKKIKALSPVFKVLSFIGAVLLPKYLRNSFKELKLVTWPSFRQSLKLTYAVIVFAVIFGASVAILDYGLDKVFKHVLLK